MQHPLSSLHPKMRPQPRTPKRIHLSITNFVQLEIDLRRQMHRLSPTTLRQPDPDTTCQMNCLIIDIYPICPLLSEPVTQQHLTLREHCISGAIPRFCRLVYSILFAWRHILKFPCTQIARRIGPACIKPHWDSFGFGELRGINGVWVAGPSNHYRTCSPWTGCN